MLRVRYILYTIVFFALLSVSSCKDKVICPAFQSTYILNDSLRMAKFSLFGEDSLPKYQVASRRSRYGISKKYRLFNYHRKNYDLRSSPKENQLGPPAKDPLFIYPEDTLEQMDEGVFLASDFADSDSTAIDSTAVVPDVIASANTEPKGPKYKYRYDQRNPYSTEQMYYNKYFGDLLVDKRPPAKPVPPQEESVTAPSDTTATEKKSGLGFFKKKKKQEADLEQGDTDEKQEETAGEE